MYQPFFQKTPQSAAAVDLIVGRYSDQTNEGEKESMLGLAVGRAGRARTLAACVLYGKSDTPCAADLGCLILREYKHSWASASETRLCCHTSIIIFFFSIVFIDTFSTRLSLSITP
jgi:hypothetical protein